MSKIWRKEIKPCPLCGGNNLSVTSRKSYVNLWINVPNEFVNDSGRGILRIECRQCNLGVHIFDTDVGTNDYDVMMAECVDRWNRLYNKTVGAVELPFENEEKW